MSIGMFSMQTVDRLLLSLNGLRALMEMGGPVMWALMAASVLLWSLAIERYWVLFRCFPRIARLKISSASAAAQKLIVRAEIDLLLRQHLRLIGTLSAILPMLGLLGTVSGIIETFDLIRLFGSTEVRIIARGVSQALITTLTGLVMGLLGVGLGYDLRRRARRAGRRFAIMLERGP